MRYPSFRNIILVATLIILSVIFLRLGSFLSFPDTSWSLEQDERITLGSNKKLKQKFAASQNNLSGIEVLFSSSNTKPGGRIDMAILDESCDKKIRESSISFSSLVSDKTYDFNWPAIPDSKDKIYCLSLNFIPRKKDMKGIKIFINDDRPENYIYLYNEATGEELSGKTLTIRPNYKNTNFSENLEHLNQRISQYKPWFLKHYFLYFISFGFILLSITIVVTLIINGIK